MSISAEQPVASTRKSERAKTDAWRADIEGTPGVVVDLSRTGLCAYVRNGVPRKTVHGFISRNGERHAFVADVKWTRSDRVGTKVGLRIVRADAGFFAVVDAAAALH